MPKYFDAHSHLNFPQFDEDRDKVIERMREEEIWTIAVGVDIKTSREVVELAEKHDEVFATVGVHPDDTDEKFEAGNYEEFLKSPNVVAVGECGLDYFRDGTLEKQKEVFESQIDFALKHNKPLMLHGRPSKGTMDAYEDTFDILNSYFKIHNSKLRGNVHFFVGNVDIAAKFLELGFTLSFDGPITFARDYDEMIKYVPLESILAETDAPFAAPEPYRGKRNEPVYVKEVVKAIARIKGEDEEVVRAATVQNTLRVFGIGS